MTDFGTLLVVQDCLERAWSRADHLRSREEMRVWLFAILHNLHVSGMRRAGARRRVPPGAGQRWRGVPLPAPEETVVAGDIERALGCLDDDQRAAVLLVGLEDLSYREAASVLEIPQGTLMSRLHRGRRRLRELLDGDVNADERQRLKRVK